MTHALFRNAAAHADGFRDVDPLLFAGTVARGTSSAPAMCPRSPEYSCCSRTSMIRVSPRCSCKTRGWDPNQELVVVCRSGGRSGAAARQLVQMGFTHVMNLRGGMLGYAAAKLPVDRAEAQPTA